MRVKVKEGTISALLNVRGDWLLKDDKAIMVIREVQYIHDKPEATAEDQHALPPNTSYFKRKRDEKRAKALEAHYVTKLVVEGYHRDGKFIGTYNEEFCERLLGMQDNDYDGFCVYKLRTAWDRFEEEIDAFRLHDEKLAAEAESETESK